MFVAFALGLVFLLSSLPQAQGYSFQNSFPQPLSWKGELPRVSIEPQDLQDLKEGKPGKSASKILNAEGSINHKILSERAPADPKSNELAVKLITEASNLYPDRKDLAIPKFKQAIEKNPKIAIPWDILGLDYHEKGNTDLAIEYAREAIKLTPTGEAGYYHVRLGSYYVTKRSQSPSTAMQKKYLELACENFRLAADNTLSKPEFKTQLAICFYEMGKVKEALLELKKANLLMPGNPTILTQLGIMQKELLYYKEAEENLLAAIRADPSVPDPYRVLAILYQYVYFDLTKAAMYHNAVLAAEPNDVTTLHNLGSTYSMGGKYNEAIHYYSKVLELSPDSVISFFEMLNLKMTICDWSTYDRDMKKLQTIVKAELDRGQKSTLASWYAVNYPIDALTLKKIAHNYGVTDHLPARARLKIPFALPKKLKAGEKLKVGIVTADAGDTNVGRDIVGWFRHHNEEESGIQISLYINKPPDDSSYFKDLVSHCKNIHEIHALSDLAAANLIHEHGIHILINLNGYTKYSRNEIFALRAAPIQINFKGYPGTLGVEWMDYILGDTITTPFENEHHFAEKIIQMPHAYFLGSYPDVFPHLLFPEYMKDYTRAAREDWGLPVDKFIFADFNHLRKVTPSIWMNILQEVPDSVLWLLRLPGEAEEHLKKEAQKRGVDSERIIFTDFAPIKDHLAVKSLADLFLDTLVFNAHGTAMDNLWAGLPIVTILGDQLHSRVSADFCTILGVPELIASSLEDYNQKAIDLARDALAGGSKLKDIRKKITENRMTSPLFDTARWVADWQRAMKEIWAIYERGDKPRHVAIPPNKNWTRKITDWIPKTSDFF